MIISVENNIQITAHDQVRKTIFYAKTDLVHDVTFYQALKNKHNKDLIDHIPLVHEIVLGRFQTSPAQINPISSGGTFHLLYKVDVADQTFIVRLNRLKDYRVAWEFLVDGWIYPKLFSLGLPSSSVIAMDCSRSQYPTDYQILTYIHGKPLSAFQDQETQHMNPVLLQAIGAYVARVHSIPLTGFGPLSLTRSLRASGEGSPCSVRGECSSEQGSLECIESMNFSAQPSPTGIHTNWQDYIFLRLQEHLEICMQISAITPAEADIIRNIFLENKNVLTCQRPVLLHGDLGNHNFLSQDGISINALIDWEDSMSGDAVFDVAYWGTFFRDHMLKDFLIGYNRHSALPVDFELRFWLYYLRIALSKTVHRFRFGYKDHPGRPPASLRIQKALENVCQIFS